MEERENSAVWGDVEGFGGRVWGGSGGADLQAVALVFVFEETGTDEGDVVGEVVEGVMVDAIAGWWDIIG